MRKVDRVRTLLETVLSRPDIIIIMIASADAGFDIWYFLRWFSKPDGKKIRFPRNACTKLFLTLTDFRQIAGHKTCCRNN